MQDLNHTAELMLMLSKNTFCAEERKAVETGCGLFF